MLFLVAFMFAASVTYVVWSLTIQGEKGPDAAVVSPAKRIAHLGMMSALAALLQGAPIFWPAVGQGLALFTSLPVAMAALAFSGGALPMVVATTGVLMLIHVKQATIFVFTTAPVGLAAAWATTAKGRLYWRLLVPGVALASGTLLMAYAVGIAPFGAAAHEQLGAAAAAVYVLFSLLYGALWVVLLGRLPAPLRAMLRSRVP